MKRHNKKSGFVTERGQHPTVTMRPNLRSENKNEYYVYYWTCPNCGNPDIFFGFNFCPICGIRLAWPKTMED